MGLKALAEANPDHKGYRNELEIQSARAKVTQARIRGKPIPWDQVNRARMQELVSAQVIGQKGLLGKTALAIILERTPALAAVLTDIGLGKVKAATVADRLNAIKLALSIAGMEPGVAQGGGHGGKLLAEMTLSDLSEMLAQTQDQIKQVQAIDSSALVVPSQGASAHDDMPTGAPLEGCAGGEEGGGGAFSSPPGRGLDAEDP